MRFGFVPQVDSGVLTAEEDEAGTQRQKPLEIRKGNKHFKGDLELTDGQLITNGTFVISLDFTIVSIFLEAHRATRGVGEIVRSMPEANRIDSEWIVDNLYAPYRDGKIRTEVDLIDLLVQLGIEANQPDEPAVSPAPSNAEIDEARKKIKELEARIKAGEASSPSYNDEDIALSPICTLRKVDPGFRTNSQGKEIQCTRLYFEEKVPVRIMDNWADPNGNVTKKAENLIGKKVRTTS